MKEEFNVVEKPKHYNREGAMQSIDEMILLFGIEETMSFCKLNAWKYRYRALDKNGEEDLKKSDWYLRKYKELQSQKEMQSQTMAFTPYNSYTPLTIESSTSA